MDGVDVAHNLKGRILIIGFGRFGQIASQAPLSMGVELTVIDNDADRIRDAARYGFKVFFGDGARLDTLRHSVPAKPTPSCCVPTIPRTRCRSWSWSGTSSRRLDCCSEATIADMPLIRAGVDYQIRETVESAYLMGAEGLRALGFAQSEVEEAAEDIRRRDTERLAEQVQGDAMSGRDHLLLQPVPEPLTGR
jgi:glutathione-regulated potassium-efflux system protein KefB